MVKDITALNANGGGDTPEAVNQGLHSALNDLKWTDNKKEASKLLFLIGDAAPHIYPNDYNWEAETKNAISRGIQINTIGCDGLDSGGTSVFEKIAKLSDGKFETLAYRQEIVDASGKKETLITSGGARYRVKAGAESEWKSGARDLAAKGLAVAEPAAPRASMYKASRAMMGAPGMASFAEGRGGGLPATSMGASINRGDSNLDDVMLNAAMGKLKKILRLSIRSNCERKSLRLGVQHAPKQQDRISIPEPMPVLKKGRKPSLFFRLLFLCNCNKLRSCFFCRFLFSGRHFQPII